MSWCLRTIFHWNTTIVLTQINAYWKDLTSLYTILGLKFLHCWRPLAHLGWSKMVGATRLLFYVTFAGCLWQAFYGNGKWRFCYSTFCRCVFLNVYMCWFQWSWMKAFEQVYCQHLKIEKRIWKNIFQISKLKNFCKSFQK